MSMHLYAFGSICRGEIDAGSDIDLLACISEPNPSIEPDKFSIYRYARIKKMWDEGNPFSWHLHLESKLIYSSDGTNFIEELKEPSEYINAKEDCKKFLRLFEESFSSLVQSPISMVFNLSCMFLAVRNFATCYSLGIGKPVFSRLSPFFIEQKLPVEKECFDVLVRARILSTRGYGAPILKYEVDAAKLIAPAIADWMNECLYKERAL